MVTEFAGIVVKPGTAAEFIAGVEASKPLFARAPGCYGMELHRSVETPLKFVLLIKWESVAHHIELWRSSEDYKTWRANAAAFFDATPNVWHSETVVG